MFMAAAFGMMALLSLPLSIPPLSVLVAPVLVPPIVKVPVGPDQGPSAAAQGWGRPGLAAAATSPAVPLVERGPAGGPADQGPGSPPGGGQDHGHIRHSLHDRIQHKVVRAASQRIKALVRGGELNLKRVLDRGGLRLERRQGPVAWGHAIGHGHGGSGSGHGHHGSGRGRGHGHGSSGRHGAS